MAQPAVRQTNPETRLPFPLNLRPLLAGWNLLFHSPAAFAADPTKSEAWNRGAYLVEGLGHCGACHTPRNALGAEKASLKLAGGVAEGWTAPPLTALSHAPIPWSEQELFTYLRSGISQFHGVAAGPMAPVVKELGALPDSDIRAMATYLASFNPNAPTHEAQQAMAARLETITSTKPLEASQQGARIYDGACAVCHEPGGPQWFGSRPSLALNSNLHGASPDNLARVIVEGITKPINGELGAMPGFAESLNDQQLTELIRYLRTRFAPDKPAWNGIDTALRAARGVAR
jgi:nicotinate dehydrogenase subunit B